MCFDGVVLDEDSCCSCCDADGVVVVSGCSLFGEVAVFDGCVGDASAGEDCVAGSCCSVGDGVPVTVECGV